MKHNPSPPLSFPPSNHGICDIYDLRAGHLVLDNQLKGLFFGEDYYSGSQHFLLNCSLGVGAMRFPPSISWVLVG